MGLQISEFVGVANLVGDLVQVPDGPPVRVNNASGAYTVGAATLLIRIKGTGSISWPGASTPEDFEGVEYRRAREGDQFTVN